MKLISDIIRLFKNYAKKKIFNHSNIMSEFYIILIVYRNCENVNITSKNSLWKCIDEVNISYCFIISKVCEKRYLTLVVL